MGNSPVDAEELQARLEEHGLKLWGATDLAVDDCPVGEESRKGMVAALVGNAGPSMWRSFDASDEKIDGNPDPLDRWTRKVVTKIGDEAGLVSRFPSDKPWWPFQRISARVMGLKQSPLGILIHPEYGLWHAFRALLLVEPETEIVSHLKGLSPDPEAVIHPCDSCMDKPCISACPVDAFGSIGAARIDRGRCLSHVVSGATPHCLDMGCYSRSACPVGKEWRYGDAQLKFHMLSYSSSAAAGDARLS